MPKVRFNSNGGTRKVCVRGRSRESFRGWEPIFVFDDTEVLDLGVTLIRDMIWGAKLKRAGTPLVRKDSGSGGRYEGLIQRDC